MCSQKCVAILPPLETSEWLQLYDLATGKQEVQIPKLRSSIIKKTIDPLEQVVKSRNGRLQLTEDLDRGVTTRSRASARKLNSRAPIRLSNIPHQALSTMADRPTVAHAKREDVKEILAMIRELAAYEKSEDLVEATEESLSKTLTFESSTTPAYAKTLILRLPAEPAQTGEEPEAVAGMALYFNNYSTWRAKPGIYLEDLYVRPSYRGRGYGKLLIQALAREVLHIDGGRLEWSCLKWNEPSLKFYRSLGAQEMNGWIGLRVDGENLVKLAAGDAA
ncbi:hypothetical protein AMS68_006544 [Peltaster fructicola]|uniref:N-acetyltransferase domain-containing protein n=1 Tax=Peltaster fructicola TaxID=286661 RepID=A0A6H0Y210_9PEZI|nr:hypothetical protein AMS68_006544 [Peltaster fructicola]